jgi:hypothetical protein
MGGVDLEDVVRLEKVVGRLAFGRVPALGTRIDATGGPVASATGRPAAAARATAAASAT